MAAKTRKPPVPAGLGRPGTALWRKLVGEFEFESHELVQLELAARQLDDLARLDAAIANEGVMAVGSKGQARLSPLVVEARQARLAASRLLSTLVLPDGSEEALTPAQRRARKAAQSKWNRQGARDAATDARRLRTVDRGAS